LAHKGGENLTLKVYSNVFRYLPWAREGLFVLFRLILAVGLMEGVRSGYFAGLLPFYAPEKLHLGPTAFTLAYTLHQLSENFFKTFGGLLAERVGFGLTLSLAAFVGFSPCSSPPWPRGPGSFGAWASFGGSLCPPSTPGS
jgi:hypothetical protein